MDFVTHDLAQWLAIAVLALGLGFLLYCVLEDRRG